MTSISISPVVSEAMRLGRPLVALESAVITSGLPRTPLNKTPDCEAPGWREDQPVNLETILLLERLLREDGVEPATIAVMDGKLHIGLDDDALTRLATDTNAQKISASGIASAIKRGGIAGMTVSATLSACQRVGPIRVFSTGGIGGVHRGWTSLPDVSGDLDQISRTQTCIVCAGAKSILDLPATLEKLESLNVPVIGFQTDHFPRFHCSGAAKLPVPLRCDEVGEVCRMLRTHWIDLGSPTGVLLANEIPAAHALDETMIEEAIRVAEEAASARGMRGAARTPFLLEELVRQTSGASLEANIALLVSNARLAGKLARSWCE